MTVISVVLLSSCAQYNLLQDGRTEGKGNGSISAIIATGNEYNEEATFIPNAILAGSLGISKRIDLRLSASLGGNLLFAPKIQVLGNQKSKFALSLNPGYELQTDLAGSFSRAHFGAIASYHPNEALSIFIEPKLIQGLEYLSTTGSSRITGGTVGAKYLVGNRFDLALGMGFFRYNYDEYFSYKDPFNMINISVGVNFKLGKKYKAAIK